MDSFPKCQVCHKHFTLKGPAPYLLPCLHAVCKTCVISTNGGVISCSTCEREVNLTETHLKKDMVRQREIFHLTVQHRSSGLLCTHEDDRNQAVCWCQECDDFLCENCQNLHESFKATRKHAVQEIPDIQPGSLDHEEYCNIHTSRAFDFWDKECDCLICGRCRRGDHADHVAVDVDEAADAARAAFETQEKEIHRIGESHHSLHQTTQEQLRRANGTFHTLKDEISHTVQSLKALLDQREMELIIALQQHTDQAKSQLHKKATVEQYCHLRCKLTTAYIKKALLYSSKYDLLKLKRTIEDTTQICLHSAPAKEQENIPLPVFNPQEAVELKVTLSSFGEIVTLEDLPSRTLLPHETVDYVAQLETVDQEHKQTIKSLEKRVENYKMAVKKHEQTLGKLGLSPDITYHLLKTNLVSKSFILQCLHLKYDREKVNLKWTHINDAGELVNKAEIRAGCDTSGRFQNYCGTTSTVPLPLTDSPQYMEIQTNVGMMEPLEGRELVLETGIYRNGIRDLVHSIPAGQYCFRLEVAHCPRHNSVCTRVCNDGKVVHHLADTLPNTAGSHTTLHHGIVFNTEKNRIVFLDVKQMQIILALDNVNYTQPMWPMFGLYAQDRARVCMKLVVGNDIDITPEKKVMILKAL